MSHDDRSSTPLPGAEPAREDDASARGIIQCLQLLAEEASTLQLPRTLEALRGALEACRAESAIRLAALEEHASGPPAGALIH